MKKKVFFLADSAVDLFELYNKLKREAEVIWIVYNQDVYNELKKKNVKNIILSNLGIKYLNNLYFLGKCIKFVLHVCKINLPHKNLYNDLNELLESNQPSFIVTDTVNILSNFKTYIPKISLKHSVPFKKFFLDKENFNYDINFLPGQYHKKRITKFYNIKDKEILKKLKVVGNFKLSYFVKNKRKVKKVKYNLKPWRTVLYAPTHDAFEKNKLGKFRFAPVSFGDQFEFLENLQIKLKLLKYNLIVKFHHYHNFYLKNPKIKELNKKENCYIFQGGINHDIFESNDVIKYSDIIITDTSGIGTTGAYLDKKLIFIQPRINFNWQEADIEKSEARIYLQ